MTNALIARAAVVPVMAEPDTRAEQVTQLVLGETAALVGERGEWRKLRTEGDHYEGWAHVGYLLAGSAIHAEAWQRSASAWSDGAVVHVDDARIALPLRARVALEDRAVRLPDGRLGSVASGGVRQYSDVTQAARAVAPHEWAWSHYAGAPYEWGGVTPWGVDCSGLVQTTWLARGVRLPRDARLQVDVGDVVSPAATRPGDLLFFRGNETERITHVAFAAGGDCIVHSTIACGGVVREPWGPGTRAAPLRERLVAVRRVAW